MNTKSYFNKVIGENAGGIYVMRFPHQDLKGGFTVERYSHNMDFIESENLELGKKEVLVRVFSTDSGLVFIKYSPDKEFGTVTMLRTGFSVRNQKVKKDIYRAASIEKGDDVVQADFDISRKLIGLWIQEVNPNSEQVFVHIRCDLNGNVSKQENLNTGYHFRQVDHNRSCISTNGNAAMVFSLLREDRRESDPSHTEHFLLCSESSKPLFFQGLGDHLFFLSGFEVVYNEFLGYFVVSGLYDYKSPDAAHGIVSWKYIPGSDLSAAGFAPFDRKFVSSVIGAKREKDGYDPENYKVRKVIPRDDGGLLMICEYFEITQQMETFYLNGIPQTSSKSVYNYNDLLFVSMDSSGRTEWRHKINKRQNSFAGMAYLQSIGVYVCEENVNLVYNDNSNQSNRVIHIKITRDGVMKQKIILNSDNEYTAIIPLEGRQTGYNRFVTPVMQSRQTMLLQIVDEN